MKTKKYVIEFECLEVPMSTPIEISAKKYREQLALLMEKVTETACDEFPMEYREYTTEFTGCVQTRHYFTVGTADTILTATICKEGYHIK